MYKLQLYPFWKEIHVKMRYVVVIYKKKSQEPICKGLPEALHMVEKPCNVIFTPKVYSFVPPHHTQVTPRP